MEAGSWLVGIVGWWTTGPNSQSLMCQLAGLSVSGPNSKSLRERGS